MHTILEKEHWLTELKSLRPESNLSSIQTVLRLFDHEAQAADLEEGLGIAQILLSLGLDNETLAASILYPQLRKGDIHLDSISELLGESSAQLLKDVLQMQSLGKLQHLTQPSHAQIENLRKMLLAMITDVRAVILILAERLCQLRTAKTLSEIEQHNLAHETLSVYAPLANRLGIWQLKWEIEDLCLKYLHNDIYSTIAKGIATRRADREHYVSEFIKALQAELKKAGLKNFEVTGRVKHIYSIYKKMQRKNYDLEQIYDMSALRILVHTIDDCYLALSLLQVLWPHVAEEFDDYISSPKQNGYRSIHTVIKGPENHFVEIQIRTYEMHSDSELGVASHWRYKEGILENPSYEAKIALLRQIMAWQKEVSVTDHTSTTDVFADRIYVFTPIGEIIDLPKDATPLDFAYHIHSELGHRCRGAKVNGNMVPLTYTLQTSDRVEILTFKQARPSRDWARSDLGYLKTNRARAKVLHWFKVKDVMLA